MKLHFKSEFSLRLNAREITTGDERLNIHIDLPFQAAGDAAIQEDRYAIHPGEPTQIFVGDGVSGLYLPQEGPRTFFGLSGGQLAAQVAAGMFSTFNPTSVADKLAHANGQIRVVATNAGLSLEEPEFLPGTAFLALQANEHESTFGIISGGDCFAFWRTSDGALYGTPSRKFDYELELTQKIAELMREASGDTLIEKRQNMWQMFGPFLAEKRRQATNQEGGHALLNGQIAFEESLREHKAPVRFYEIKMEEGLELIVCTDGFVPFKRTQDPKQAATFVFSHYDQGGLAAVAQATWRQTVEEEWKSHVSRPEATAIRITVVE